MPVAWQALAEASSERNDCPIDAGIVPAVAMGILCRASSTSLTLLQGCIMVPWNLY